MRQKDPASVILDVAAALTSKLRNGDYDKTLATVAQPWQSLQVSDKAQLQDVDSLDSDDEPQLVQRKRLDLEAILKHFRRHGPTGTFIASVCSLTLQNGCSARLVYVLPKYSLQHAAKRKQEMASALRLALATSEEEVARAAASLQTGLVGHLGSISVIVIGNISSCDYPFIKELCLFQYLLICVGYSWQERLYVSSYTEYLIAMTFARPIGFPSNQQHSLLYLLVFDKGKYVIPLSYGQVLMIACAICISEKTIAPFGCRWRTSCTKVISICFGCRME